MCGRDDVFHETNQGHQHSLLLLINVIQSTRKLLPVAIYTERLVRHQMVNRIVGVQPLSVSVMNEREVIVELKEDNPITEVSQLNI